MQFKPFAPGIEVNGQTAYAILDGFKDFEQLASKFLLLEGIGTRGPAGLAIIEPEGWYKQAAWLRAFENIAKQIGDRVLFQIGVAIPRNAKFPPFVVDVVSAIRSIDIAYHMNHRKDGVTLFDPKTGQMSEGIGHYGCEVIPDKNMIVSVCNNPYPCAFDRGILTAMAQRFDPTSAVAHDDAAPCRKNGGESCTYMVTWRG
ncbi:MAG: hypothetical protein Q8Q09_00195 [Deltaproteobacteria bacterium]|nr:hypothetical protein [Deltaproteobacteria bacterium]